MKKIVFAFFIMTVNLFAQNIINDFNSLSMGNFSAIQLDNKHKFLVKNLDSKDELLVFEPKEFYKIDKDRILFSTDIGFSLFSITNGHLKTQILNDGFFNDEFFFRRKSISPNGKWNVYAKKNNDDIFLYLQETSTFFEREIAKIPIDCKLNVSWSADSNFFVYENDGQLFFENATLLKNTKLNKGYSKIGKGSINSVFWTKDNNLVYFDNGSVFLINENELYQYSIYSDLFKNKKLFFDLKNILNNCDYIFLSEDKKELFIRNGMLLFNFSCKEREKVNCYYLSPSLVSLKIEESDDSFYILEENFSSKTIIEVFEINKMNKKMLRMFNDFESICLLEYNSVNNKFAFITDKNELYICQENKILEKYSDIKYFVWLDKNNICVAKNGFVECINLNEKKEKILFPSLFDNFSLYENFVVISQNNNYYENKKSIWEKTEKKLLPKDNLNYRNDLFSKNKPSMKIYLGITLSENSDVYNFLKVIKTNHIDATFFINDGFLTRYKNQLDSIIKSGNKYAHFLSFGFYENDYVYNKQFITTYMENNNLDIKNKTDSEILKIWYSNCDLLDDIYIDNYRQIMLKNEFRNAHSIDEIVSNITDNDVFIFDTDKFSYREFIVFLYYALQHNIEIQSCSNLL